MSGGPGRTTLRGLVSRGLGSVTPGRWAAVRPHHGAVPSPPHQGCLQAPGSPDAPTPPTAPFPGSPGPGTASRPQAPAGLRGLSADFPQRPLEPGPSLHHFHQPSCVKGSISEDTEHPQQEETRCPRTSV